MTTGQMIMYGGIALFALSLIGEIVSTIAFSVSKKKMLKKIYEGQEE